MNLVRVESGQYYFRLSYDEKMLMAAVLDRYPMTPPAHYAVSRKTRNMDEPQQMLADSMASLRQDHVKWIRSLLQSKDRFERRGSQLRVSFSREKMERLLQIMNDVRVGAWVLLGQPDSIEKTARETDGEKGCNWALMDLAGAFQCIVLEALEA